MQFQLHIQFIPTINMGDEEWTFVPQRKGSKPKHKNQNRNRKDKHTVSGLYGATVHNNSEEHENSNCTDEQKLIERERIKHNVLECIQALESQIQMGSGLFTHRLISSLVAASSTTNTNNELQSNTTIKDDKSVGSTLHIREIVAYGIGNFAKGNYHASILQLACLLLIRRRAALAKQHSTTMIDTNHQPTTTTSDAATITTTDSFEYDQTQVPIYYYEPCILPIEKELLESMFHIYVLTSNEFGKRSVESMRQELIQQRQQQPSSSTNTVPSNTSTSAVSDSSDVDTECLHTLFYMPHCPMQLYSNVLWAHWDYIFPRQQQKCTKDSTTEDDNTSPTNDPSSHENSSNKSIIIFGNSFHAYDDRTISSEKRLNPTNGLYRVIPFINETIVSVQPRDCRGEDAVDALRYLDNAFNDCNVMSFASCNGNNDEGGCIDKKIMPERPKEWFASDDPNDNGELL